MDNILDIYYNRAYICYFDDSKNIKNFCIVLPVALCVCVCLILKFSFFLPENKNFDCID